MKIELKNIKISELVSGYLNDDEDGVVGFHGKLNLRPPYQREFVYKGKDLNAVIDTVRRGFPLNVMYWVENNDGTLEVLDGQQRGISICEYFSNNFSINDLTFDNLTQDKKQEFLDYELMVYFCKGTESEKLEWFRTINISGLKLKEQELRNAIYTGAWLTDAKMHFSKTNCVAYQLAGKLMEGEINRQDYLATVLKWISNDKIESYMSKHQNDKDANELWQYFFDVNSWVNKTFIVYRKQMKGLDWGILYNKYMSKKFNTNEVESQIKALMEDEEVSNKKGIYEFVLSGEEKHLNLRAFGDKDKVQAFEKQVVVGTGKANCPKCDKSKLFDLNEMEADHIVPWSKGGKTTLDNCQMLCKYHNGVKSNN